MYMMKLSSFLYCLLTQWPDMHHSILELLVQKKKKKSKHTYGLLLFSVAEFPFLGVWVLELQPSAYWTSTLTLSRLPAQHSAASLSVPMLGNNSFHLMTRSSYRLLPSRL